MLYLRYQVRTAVGWRVVSELVSRHHPEKLRVYETHPGGGLYDCLAIIANKGDRIIHLCDFNIESQHFHVMEPYGEPQARLEELRWPDGNNFVVKYLDEEDLSIMITQIQDILGLPKRNSNRVTPYAMVIQVIASLLQRFMLSQDIIEARSGLLDSSGGCDIVRDLYEVPSIAEELSKFSDHSEEQDYVAREYWLLFRKDHTGRVQSRLLVNTRGQAYFFDDRYPINLWKISKDNGIRTTVDLIANQLS